MATPARLGTATTEFVAASPREWTGYLARALAGSEKLFDFATVVTAIYATDAITHRLRPGAPEWRTPSVLLFSAGGFAMLFVFLLERHGGYRPCLSLLAIRETERVLRVTLQSFSIALVAAYLAHAGTSRLSAGVAVVLVPLLLTLEKWEARRLLSKLRSKGYGTRRAIILGTGSAARRIYSSLVASPKFGVEPVAFLEQDADGPATEIYECGYRRTHSARVLYGPLEPALFRRLGVSVLVVADPVLDQEQMLAMVSESAAAGVTTYIAAEEFLAPNFWVDFADLDGIMLARFSHTETRSIYEIGKRALDLTIAGLLLLLFTPLGAVITLLVKRTSSGPVLFRQERVGQAGRPFTMYKFRTMYNKMRRFEIAQGTGRYASELLAGAAD